MKAHHGLANSYNGTDRWFEFPMKITRIKGEFSRLACHLILSQDYSVLLSSIFIFFAIYVIFLPTDYMPCKSNYKKFQVTHYWPVPIYSQENVDVKMVHTRASQLVSFK